VETSCMIMITITALGSWWYFVHLGPEASKNEGGSSDATRRRANHFLGGWPSEGSTSSSGE
jgi:hypothetical protein